MQYIELTPSKNFQNTIERYTYCSTGDVNHNCWFRAMPNGHPEFFFNLKDSKFLIYAEAYKLNNTHTFIVGLHDAYFGSYILNRSPMRSFIVTFKLFGLQRLLGIKESSLVNNIVDAGQLLNRPIDIIWQKLNHATSPEEMKSHIEDFLGQFDASNQTINIEMEEVIKVAKYIHTRHGMLNIEEISRCVLIHRRKLERLFKKNVGLSPLAFSRIFRFMHLFVHATKSRNLIEMAETCGYYDQSHFIRDFKRVTGIAPEFFLEAIKPNFYNHSETNRTYFPVIEDEIIRSLPCD